jgi:hypothetical protein
MNYTTHVFVDFENVSDIDLGLIDGKPVHVTLMIGKNQKKLNLSLVQQIHRLSAQVKLVEVGATGRNALDMTLAYYLGQAVQKFPTHQFHIVSGDKDYDALLAHLKTQQHKVTRCPHFDTVPGLPKTKKPVAKPAATSAAKPSPKADREAIVLERFISPTNTNKPSKKSALSSHLKTSLGKTATDAMVEELIRKLIDKKILQIDEHGKVLYGAA